ncbi:MAG: acetolactate synthase small subunit [Lachnospiraceae bacterium]|nr:acetolactate synthase small subunit [Lachnospiraceae bacterium]
MKKKVLSILVDNSAGVLSRVSGLFSRRGYNIDSLTVGETENPAFSRMTVVARGDDQILDQIKKQLEKLEDVREVKELEDGKSVTRELVLITIGVSPEKRGEITSLAEIFRANIVDVEVDSVMVEITGNQRKISAFISLLDNYEIIELVRTGIAGLGRGKESFDDDMSD